MVAAALLLTLFAIQRPAPPLDIVEVVGCLSEISKETWVMTRGAEPLVSKVPFTNADAVSQAGARPLGTRQYRLIGVSPFQPAMRKGHKVVVKGVLIKDTTETRINVTSLQTASDTCTVGLSP